ncbi:hypothetical protein ABPG74_007986 [Tetrahymena malaccensis]
MYKSSNKSSFNTSYQEGYKQVQSNYSQNCSQKEQKSVQQDQTQLLVWGYDSHGQLGLGQKQQGGNCYFSPKFCCFNISIQQISCGSEHSAFLAHNGNVYMIGSNKQGQLGIGSKETISRSVPVLLESLGKHTIVKVSCGGGHSGAISSRGFLFMWGEGIEGQLGTGKQENIYSPTQLEVFSCRNISCGKKNTIVLSGQKAYGFGDCRQGQLGTGRKVVEYCPAEIPLPSFEGHLKSVSCGDNHTLFLTDQGEVFACGNNSFGQLGTGQEVKSSLYLTKIRIKQQQQISSNFQNSRVISVKAGYAPSSIALTDDGQLYVWGTAFFGYYDEPQLIQADSIYWKGFSQGNNFICLTDDQGRAYSWGQNINGELGLGLHPSHQQQAYPQEIQINMEDKYVKKIECGQHFSFAILSNKQNIVNNTFNNEQDICSQLNSHKNSFISSQHRTSINKKHQMLAEQINQFSQQIQKFQSDYPSLAKNNQMQENDNENSNNFQQADQTQIKRQSNNSSFSQNILQIDSLEDQNKPNILQNKKHNRSISVCLNNSQNRQQQDIQLNKNLRINTQNNAQIERCETEYVKQMSNKNQGTIKLDQILPNYFTNHRVLTESADFSVNNINKFQNNQQFNIISQSIPGNFKQETMQNNFINMKQNESIQINQPYKNTTQNFDHLIQNNNFDQNILNLSEIAFNQSEIIKENNSNLQNNYQQQNEQATCLKDVFDKTSQSFYQQQNQINSQIQYSQNKIDHLQQQNNSFVGKIQDIQLKYDLIQKQLEQSQQENKSLKKQLSEEKNKNVNLQIRVDHLTKKSKQLQKKNELLLLEIDMNKKTYEMKCEALLKQIYNYQSLETITDKNNLQQLNKMNQQQYETLLENFITINENGQNNNLLDISNSQVKNMQTFADAIEDKENIQMNNQFVKKENNSKLSSQFQSSKVSVSQDFMNLVPNNEQFQNNQYNIFDMKDLQIQINPQSPFSNSNASKKLTMKLNQLSLINRNNQPYQINEDL